MDVRRADVRLSRVVGRLRVVAPRVARSTAFLSMVLAAISWAGDSAQLAPGSGVDGSWHAALAMAAHGRLPWGTRVAFTFGPLGFLTDRALYFSSTAITAFVFRFGLAGAMFAVLLSAARRYLPIAIAVVVAYISGYALVALWSGDEAALGVALALCIACISQTGVGPPKRWRWIALGAMAGLFTLEKLSLGVAIVALCAIALACAPRARWREFALTAVPASSVFVVGWFGTGNGFTNLIAYLRTSEQVSSGYSAMAINSRSNHHQDIVIAAIGAATIGAAAIAHARHLVRSSCRERAQAVEAAPPVDAPNGQSRSDRMWEALIAARAPIGVVLATSLTTWTLFKEGFVRQDRHRLVFFASIPLILSAFRLGAGRGQPPARSRWTRLNGATMVTVVLAFSLISFGVAGSIPASFVNPPGSLRNFFDTAFTLALPTRRHDIIASARARRAHAYNLPPEIVARTSGQTVDIDPSEQTVAWAYPSMHWDPLPTLQDYAAYTTALDMLDVNYILSSNAPRFILRQEPGSIDGRLPIFDPPATQLAIECNYRHVDASAIWELVERTPNRCGAAKKLEQVSMHFGDRTLVPEASPGEMIVASFDLHLSALWHVLDTAYKTPEVFVDINDSIRSNRFVVRTAPDLHVLQPPSALGYAAGFAPPTIHSLAFNSKGGGFLTSRITVTYYSIAFASP
ncbi:MAG TPA: hypothetical protein VIK54_15835 [Acidimicrobiia bacterium]